MYVSGNPKTKKAIKVLVADGVKLTVYNPGLGGLPPIDGEVAVEGPHYPSAHTFYGTVTLKDGFIVSIK